MALLRFDGRVALVTGAGGGLGKEYALLLASRGAKVVVNDLGGDTQGGGKSSVLADEVVATIRANGGTAVANYDSVEEGDKVVKTAIDNFGRIDIVINNAGILRDRTVTRISDADWDIIQRVHVKGAFVVTRAAWPYMRQQQYGRIIMTSSPSGLYGNFGQANYSAAKMGLVGLSNTLAKEGAKYNIKCNALAPTAYSRLSAHVMPPQAQEILKAEYVAPVVAFLCHESCQDSGIIVETGGGWTAKVRLQKSSGAVFHHKPFSIEDVSTNWSKITDMSKPLYHTTNEGIMAYAFSVLSGESGTGTSVTGLEPKEEAKKVGDAGVRAGVYTYTPRDVILYALGVGASLSQTDTSELKFLYEGHEDFSVLPSFAVIPAQTTAMSDIFSRGVPGLKEFNPAQILHGEQYVELKGRIPTSGTLYSEGRITDVLDKKSGALVLVDVDTKTEAGQLVCTNQFSIFINGAGGFGGKRASPHDKPTVRLPERAPDATLQQQTLTTQAALYRLNGDYNPLHIDPQFAAVGGFSTPILHGLCSYGVATRHVLKQYCNNDVTMIKAIKARFAKPVLPGQTIQTDMWKEGSRVFFRCKVAETGDIVLNGGYMDLNITDIISTASVSHSPSKDAPQTQPPGDGLQSTLIFEQLQQLVTTAPDIVQKVKAIFLWNITKDGKTVAQWTVDLKNPPGAIYRGTPRNEKAGCTLTLSDELFVDMASGKITGQQAFFQGKVKIGGNVMLSQKLQTLFAAQSKL
ncbi:hypothetical protein EMCRGX_G022586 [Ephydatia muelleri]